MAIIRLSRDESYDLHINIIKYWKENYDCEPITHSVRLNQAQRDWIAKEFKITIVNYLSHCEIYCQDPKFLTMFMLKFG